MPFSPRTPLTLTTHSTVEILRDAVAAAIQAPSSHNTQPWRFRIADGRLELFADPTRHLHVIDAERRQQIQSCGCALYNARIAVRAAGFTDVVTDMVVDVAEPTHLATLSLGEPHITTELDHALMAAVPQRRTNRRAFLKRPVGQVEADALGRAATAEGASIIRLDPTRKRELGLLIDYADREQFGNPAFRAELGSWLTSFGSRRRDGIPFVEKEYGSALPFTVMRALRSPSLGGEFGAIEEELVLGAPVVFALGTDGDQPWQWLLCGQALQAVLLRATAIGLSASFLNQVLEIPELRGQVAELLPEIPYPQMIVRLGIPEEPVRHPAPRRDIAEVLDII